MSFLRSRKFKGSKPVSKSSNTAVVSSNGRVVNPFQDTTNTSSNSKQPPPSSQVISVPHSNSATDLPNARKMIALQEYHPNPTDSKGLHVRRGETVMVLSQEHDWCLVRNERNKEGYVPCAHLVAPYSTMRSGRQKISGGPIRPVASGSSIDVMDHSLNHGIPMYPSRSAGRPRNYSMGDDNRIHSSYNHSMSNMQQRMYSPQDMGYGHHGNAPPPPPHASHGQNSANPANSYDQKYSPSTSSGVASLTGTGSPVGHSDGSQHSSFCSIEEERREGERESGEGAPASLQNGVGDNSREVSRMRGRATSETNIAYPKPGKPPALPPSQSAGHPPSRDRPLSSEQPRMEPGVTYNSSNEEDIPPPLPPRSLYYNINPPNPQNNIPLGEAYVPPPEEYNSQEESDPYAAPVDAIPRNPSPHLGNQPNVQNAGDTYPRRDNIRTVDDNGVYTEVYQGYQRPQQRIQNGYHLSNGVEEHVYSVPPSEDSSSHSRSSKLSGSRVSSLRTQTTEPYNNSRELMSHESDMTPNGDRNEGMGRDYAQRPHSANPIISGSGPIKTFRKNLWGLYTVTNSFDAFDENEVNVQEGDHVSVWNQDDPEWYWIVKHDTNEEGFVPSSCLKEINSDTHNISRNYNTTEFPHQPVLSENVGNTGNSNTPPPPVPPRQPQLYPKPPAPKPPRPPPTGAYDHTQHRFRDRCTSQITSHDSRPSSIPPPVDNISGGGGGYGRRRLNSDGTVASSLRGQSSTSSIERREPSISPPNSPPPPYSKYDQNQSRHTHHNHAHIPPPTQQLPPPPRHYSLSQHERPGHTHSMERTWSHGQVPYRRVHIPHPRGGSGRLGEEDARGDGIISPPDIFAESDGTLV